MRLTAQDSIHCQGELECARPRALQCPKLHGSLEERRAPARLYGGQFDFETSLDASGCPALRFMNRSRETRLNFGTSKTFSCGVRHKFRGIRIADKSFVAKKFHVLGMVLRDATETTAVNLRNIPVQMAGMRVPPRVRTIPSLRRRLPVTVISEPPQTINIRQVAPNLGSRVNQTRQIQNQLA